MNLKIDAEWALKAAAAFILIMAAFGKAVAGVAAAPAGAAPGSGNAALCLALGLYIAAPLLGGLLKPKDN